MANTILATHAPPTYSIMDSLVTHVIPLSMALFGVTIPSINEVHTRSLAWHCGLEQAVAYKDTVGGLAPPYIDISVSMIEYSIKIMPSPGYYFAHTFSITKIGYWSGRRLS